MTLHYQLGEDEVNEVARLHPAHKARYGTTGSHDAEDTKVIDSTIITADSAAELSTKATHATETEHALGFWRAVHLYPQAIGWSVFFSLGIIMCAFDPQLMGQLYAVPAFQRDFGYEVDGDYVVPASWQTGLSMGSPLGQVVGALAAGYPMEWYGRKKTFGACVIGTAACIFIQFFARSLKVLIIGELAGGLILGSYAVIAPAYASEVCPTALRGVLTSYVNLCFVGGQLIATGLTTGTQKLDSHWAYSAPFAAQWFWPLVILTGLPWAPESPWWLARVGKTKDAEGSLQRLARDTVDVKPTLAMIVETDRIEQETEAGSTYRSLFKKSNRRRTEIATGVYSIQVLSGIYMLGFATYFFELAGLTPDQAFPMSIGLTALGVLGTLLSFILIQYYGRRTLYLLGLALSALLMLLLALLDIPSPSPSNHSHHPYALTQSSLLLLWNLTYSLTLGPLTFTLITEVPSASLRSKTIAFATAVQATLGIAFTFLIPVLINPRGKGGVGMRGKVGFVFAGLSLVSWAWGFWRGVPETRGRTVAEVDGLFERGVGVRDFKRYRFEESERGGGGNEEGRGEY